MRAFQTFFIKSYCSPTYCEPTNFLKKSHMTRKRALDVNIFTGIKDASPIDLAHAVFHGTYNYDTSNAFFLLEIALHRSIECGYRPTHTFVFNNYRLYSIHRRITTYTYSWDCLQGFLFLVLIEHLLL